MPTPQLLTLAPSLIEYYFDKDTGLPLSGGYIRFFYDSDRGSLKPVYEQTGSPPDYSYVEISDPLYLSNLGYPIDDSGNNIKPYFNLVDDNGDPSLYYVEIYNSEGVKQTDRSGWPLQNIQESSSNGGQTLFNYIPNGQFLAHNFETQEMDVGTTNIAYGGWVYEKSDDTSDSITFDRIGSYTEDPPESPRYQLISTCNSSISSGNYKIIGVRFGDVNMFASSSQQYTLTFTAQSQNSSSFSVDVYITKNFGTGGDPTTNTFMATVVVTPDEQTFTVPLLFGSNEGANIGLLDDDFVEVDFFITSDITYTWSLNDVSLVFGAVSGITYPIQTEMDTTSRSLPAPIPAYDGSDLYLPLILTPEGLQFDDSSVGSIISTMRPAPLPGYLLADGTQYLTSGYSAEGVPYSRLQSKILSGVSVPLFGTGSFFVTIAPTGSIGYLLMTSNSFGNPTAAADGSVPTGFTFNQIVPAVPGGIGFKAYKYNPHNILIQGPQAFSVSGMAFSAGTSPFLRDHLYSSDEVLTWSYDYIRCPATGPAGFAGEYFTFNNIATLQNYYIWFTVDGSGSDPAPGGIGIKVNLFSSMTTDGDNISSSVMAAFGGLEADYIAVLSASSITPGAYWTFTIPANAADYYVWYTVDGSGTDPAVVGATGILVALSSLDSVSTVASKTMVAVNTFYFAVPDLRGVHLRGNDEVVSQWDFNFNFGSGDIVASRFAVSPAVNSDGIGTMELFSIPSHDHMANFTTSAYTATGGPFSYVGGAGKTPSQEYGNTGDLALAPESRVVNAAVNFLIKY